MTPPNDDERPSAPGASPDSTLVEDTSSAEVGDAAANAATDALIDAAEADPIAPGEPRDAHQGDGGR